MQLSPLFLIFAASAATFGIGQALLPTARAQPGKAPLAIPAEYRVRVQSLHTKRTLSGIEVTGEIVNTGRQTLTYTSVVTVFTNEAGQELGRGDGYLVAGPVRPGQAAEFRASLPQAPIFTGVTLLLHEAGHSVAVEAHKLEAHKVSLAEAQAPSKRRTTVW